MNKLQAGVVGASGFGGAELLRLLADHPSIEIAAVFGESSAGRRLAELFPALGAHAAGTFVVAPFEPERLPALDILFASLPTGKSRGPLARLRSGLKVVDVGGDHRFVEGWTYGLTELPGQRERIRTCSRLANPGCFAAAALLPLAPLVVAGLIESGGIVVDAKSGVTGTGRGGASDFGYVDTSEDVFGYGLAGHPHTAEMERALQAAGGVHATIAFTPHLVPMKRGIFATGYARPRGEVSAAGLLEAARRAYAGEPFVQAVEPQAGRSPHTRWVTASNLAFVSYAVNPRTGHVIAMGVIDNLGKGAAAQAVQNANLMLGLAETAGLSAPPLLA